MRKIIIGAAAVSALALGACHPVESRHHASSEISTLNTKMDDSTPLKPSQPLECPDHQGDLTRSAQAADGQSCDYTGPNGETVHLSLLALDGKSPVDALAPMKDELKTLIPAPQGGPVSINTSKDGSGDHANIDLPFLHIKSDGDKADVKIFGADIKADGKNATVKTGSGSKTAVIHAGPGGAEIIAEDVGTNNASLVYILAGDKSSAAGYRAVGYVAKGPVGGPLVVGRFQTQAEHHNGDMRHSDVSRLVELNLK